MAYSNSEIITKLETERDAILDAMSGESAVVKYKIGSREVERTQQSAGQRLEEIENLISRYQRRDVGRVRNLIRFKK